MSAATTDPEQLDVDYLVVGAGAMGMAFVDTILTETNATVALVDRHDRPGGHWIHSYPFVRLHQPSFFYGVNSAPLGDGTIDTVGLNAGLSELATGTEVVSYFDQVLHRTFLPSGRVTWLPMHNYDGDGALTSTVTGNKTTVTARRIVDATYMNVTVPSMRPPKYDVAEGVRLIPLNDLVEVRAEDAQIERFVVVGAGKTGIDACLWLLTHGVDPDQITWIMPRDSWLLNRAFIQPGAGFRIAEQLGLIVGAATFDEAFENLEAGEQLLRIDPAVRPTMYRCATVTMAEVELLRQIDNIVRLGRISAITSDEMILEHGSIPMGPGDLVVDCSADGLERRPVVPVFDGNTITLQTVRACQQVFSAAFIARVEASDRSDEERNTICGVSPHPNADIDFFRTNQARIRNTMEWLNHPDLLEWMSDVRLDPSSEDAPLVDPGVVMAAVQTLENLFEGMD